MLDGKEQQRQEKKDNNNKKLTIVTGSPSLNPVFKYMDNNSNNNNNNNGEDQQKQHEKQQQKEQSFNDMKKEKMTQQEYYHHHEDNAKHNDDENINTDDNNNENIINNDDNDDDDASILSTHAQRCLVMRRITYIVVVNAVTPILLYYILKPYLPPVWALVLSSTPTIISVLIQATFLRHIDTIGIASICGFLVSIILAVANGDPKLMLMRESLITAGVGAACALSLLPIRVGSFELKPIMYYIAKDLVPLKPVYMINKKKQDNKVKNKKDSREDKSVEDEDEEVVVLQPRILFYWRNSRFCRIHIRLLTAIDIVLLELEFGLKLFYIFSFDIDTVVIASSATWGTIGAMISVFTICYSVRVLKRLKRDEPLMFSTAGVATTFTNPSL